MFPIIRSSGLKLNAKKCVFGAHEITYLGEKLTKNGVQPDRNKVSGTVDMPTPRCKEYLQRALGMVTYLAKYVPNLSVKTSALRKLLVKDTEWQWIEEHTQEWKEIKDFLSKEPVLKYFDPDKNTKVSSDASKDGLGAALLQKHMDSAMTQAEKRYAQIEKELLGLVFATEKFHEYVYAAPAEGRKEEAAATLNSKAGNSPLTSNVVPVWVSTVDHPDNERLVYALLDTQSDSTFIDESICKDLKATVQPIRLRMTTMLGRDTEIACQRATGLQVRGLSADEWIPLPQAYTKDVIPLDRSHIPTCQTAKNWEHLRGISNIPPLLDCEIGLLIGYNCPQALAPREVVTGGKSEPFALRTDLGWSVVSSSSISTLVVKGKCCHSRK